MISERITEKAIAYINNLFRDNAGGHDVEHTLRVYRNALLIMQNEADCDRIPDSIEAKIVQDADRLLFSLS